MAARSRPAERLKRRQGTRVRAPQAWALAEDRGADARLAREDRGGAGGDFRDATGAAGRGVGAEAGETHEAVLGWYSRHIGMIPLLQPQIGRAHV